MQATLIEGGGILKYPPSAKNFENTPPPSKFWEKFSKNRGKTQKFRLI